MDYPGEKLLIKLWETITEGGIGSLLSPWQIVRTGNARNQVRRDELLMLAQAEADIADIRAGRKRLASDGGLRLIVEAQGSFTSDKAGAEIAAPIINLSQKAIQSNAVQMAREEINANKAIIFAEEMLIDDSNEPSEKSVDQDWLHAWREYAGKVSAIDLQRLWGNILAGEIKSPGSCSLRTLDFIKALSKEEAERISKLASYVVCNEFIARDLSAHLTSRGISFDDLLFAQELGVISSVEAIGMTKFFNSLVPGRYLVTLPAGGKVLVVEHENIDKKLQLSVYLVTAVGQQVLRLGKFSPDIEYLQLLGKQIAKQGYKVRFGDWELVSDTHGSISNEVIIEA